MAVADCATTVEEAVAVARRIGFPVLIRAAFALGERERYSSLSVCFSVCFSVSVCFSLPSLSLSASLAASLAAFLASLTYPIASLVVSEIFV
jgi:hypothetical protein